MWPIRGVANIWPKFAQYAPYWPHIGGRDFASNSGEGGDRVRIINLLTHPEAILAPISLRIWNRLFSEGAWVDFECMISKCSPSGAEYHYEPY
jgi:hypothetical protein